MYPLEASLSFVEGIVSGQGGLVEDGLQGVERAAVFMIRLGPMAECCWRDTLKGGSADVDGNDRMRWASGLGVHVVAAESFHLQMQISSSSVRNSKKLSKLWQVVRYMFLKADLTPSPVFLIYPPTLPGFPCNLASKTLQEQNKKKKHEKPKQEQQNRKQNQPVLPKCPERH